MWIAHPNTPAKSRNNVSPKVSQAGSVSLPEQDTGRFKLCKMGSWPQLRLLLHPMEIPGSGAVQAVENASELGVVL